jgi:LacI family transcriptional regulator
MTGGGGRLLGEHVLERGARRLLMLVPDQEWPSIEERRTGVIEAMSALDGAATLQILHCGDEGLVATRTALLDYLRQAGPPDAILAGNDQMGIAGLQTLKAAGLVVPRDVMVTGFNGFDFRDYSEPLLTTVRSAAYDMGAAAADVLLRRLQTGEFERQSLRLPVHLLSGESTPAIEVPPFTGPPRSG